MGVSLLGTRVEATQAAQWGLIWKCVPDAEFETEIDAVASQLASGPTLAFSHIKRAINSSLANSLDTQLALERDAMRLLGCSQDYREGVAAFLEKREPAFAGR
jgi:2-(1,2-epoxy-1,2-dihydrophenyl)acetyl-CoA isomerase